MKSFRELYPLVLADIALFSIDEKGLRVLLVRRAQEPEFHRWALPGGILQPEVDQSLEAAARRVLRDKVSMDIAYLEEVCSFSGPDRDPRGWSISVLFYALLPSDRVHALEKNKVDALEWADAANPGHRMAFDHAVQLAKALQVLRDRVERHALPLHLMPERFTLSELQRCCEAIVGRQLDKSVFRRRIKGAMDLVEVDDFVRGAQRPAQLYKARAGFTWS
jgi:8-oxo-dGTP diphosphatase